MPLVQFVIFKAVLEHTPDVESALWLLYDACRIAKSAVYVAWHTPPANVEVIRRVKGKSGRMLFQNTYRADAFEHLHYRESKVGPFVIWEINP